jgi:hypothetical protein
MIPNASRSLAVSFRMLASAVLALAVFWALPATLVAQDEALGIEDAEQECLINVPYPLVDALIRPDEEVQVAKVYFRGIEGEHFYAVQMTPGPRGFQAILPVPAPETRQVVYYVEAISSAFEASRTAEFTVDVEEECDERQFLGDEPGIVVEATEEGVPPIPPGFLPDGISATVTAGGVTTAVGGGLGGGVLTGIAVGGGILGGVLINEFDEGGELEEPASPINP